MVHRGEERQTRYVLYRHGEIREESMINSAGRRLVPFSATNNLLTHDVVVFPSEPAEYESTEALLVAVRAFIHRYCDVSDGFEEIAAHYVLFSWIYDAFNEVRTSGCAATSVRASLGSSSRSARSATKPSSRAAPRPYRRSSASLTPVEARS